MKSKPSTKTLPDSPKPTGSPTHEAIAERAYRIWMERGSEHGGSERDWLQAEEELRKAESK